MRKVAGCALFSAPLGADAPERFEKVRAFVKDWLDNKGTWESEDRIILTGGRIGSYSSSEWSGDAGRVVDHRLVEPSGNATVRTQVSLALSGDLVIAYVELQAAGDAYQLAPVQVDIHSPNIVKMLVAAYDDWHVGEAPLSVRPHVFDGVSGGETLEQVIWHPKRNLPLVVITSYEGGYLTEEFPGNVASDLAGVALVGTVDPDAALELTRRRGKEWSCFNGAVRLYWPGLTAASRYFANPLWTRFAMTAHSASAHDAAGRFRRQLRRMLLGLSAFAIPEPAELGAIRKQHADRIAAAQRQSLAADNDWEGLANSYAAENEKLCRQHDDDQAQVRDLQTTVANLQASLQWKPEGEHEVEPDQDLPPSTVVEAVETARERFANLLVFGDDVLTGAAGVASDAGPPEKVLRYLEVLAELTQAKRRGPLGTTTPRWLEERGVVASIESETIRNNGDERRRRTWHDGNDRRFFDLHLKPTDATHPNRCVRIYFDYDEGVQSVVVGWVGRHP